MKKMLAPITFLLATHSATALAEGCGNLNITIENYSGSYCTLINAQTLAGSLDLATLPKLIKSGETSQSIRMQQGFLSGPTLLLEYRCGTRAISLTTHQNYCLLDAGDVSGSVYSSSNLHAKYAAANGSWWYGLPGRMLWTIV